MYVQLDKIKKIVAEMAGVSINAVKIVVSPYRICPLGAHIDHQVLLKSGQFSGEVRFRFQLGSNGSGWVWSWKRLLESPTEFMELANLIQVVRVLPYSAVQLFAYDTYKRLFRGTNSELSRIGRLSAGAGMTSTFVTYPLDILRLRLAVDPGYQTMADVFVKMLKEEGLGSFYRGLGPSLIGIAPTLRSTFVSTVRRQMQMRGTPYKRVLDAFPDIVARDGVAGLYRGFVPNALKTLPKSRYYLLTYNHAINSYIYFR
ncbi:putative mitochondrial carrier protein [Helianthus annuus]|nr:putative mitochondrial carrier protein [Helianthus annuus]KAJ0739717.1 putative mitochondrial carrier protein [Helianthus annuus]